MAPLWHWTALLPVRTICKTVKVSASGFYGWRHRPVCQRQQANAALSAQSREAFVASEQAYGMPRMRAELQDAGLRGESRRRVIYGYRNTTWKYF